MKCVLENSNCEHNFGRTRLYRIYNNMKQRCNNPNNHKYPRYGARGIKVCDEWNCRNGLKAFGEWALQNGYSDELTLDRIDNNGNYEPSNCRWIDLKAQSNNRSDNDYIEFNGEVHTLTEWSEIIGLNRGTLWSRLHREHWSVERALTEEPFIGKTSHPNIEYLEFNGESHTYAEWEAITGVKRSIIRDRIRSNWSKYDALFTPKDESVGIRRKHIEHVC